jgi:hypothetical protein
VFEGVMTDAEVKVNGNLAGPVHQGGFYQFSYNITPLLKLGETNVLEVNVSKQSANASVNRAERDGDFWALSGIYRPVYLKIVPSTHIARIALDAKANGQMQIQVFTKGAGKGSVIEAQVQELNGKSVGSVMTANGADSSVLSGSLARIRTWNPEQPNLYTLVVSIKDKGKTVHTIKQRFGFRTAELRPNDGFYVNGVKVIFKGVDRHSAWPESGRTLSGDIHLLDIKLMKEMNMNAVRMSHYPPDQEFLDLCDSLGLFVLDELTGWQAAYDTLVGAKLVKELIVRDVNHPSVVMWANGNEGGWNRGLDHHFHFYDPQKRLVYHPWEKFNGTDTKHYPDYSFVTNLALYGTEVYFPTEFMHGLYDGGHGAALEDFWEGFMKYPRFAGGFLWVLADEGVIRVDKDSIIDTHGNHAPDGIVGPHREKEGSYYTIKEIWSPVVVNTGVISKPFNGRISLENRYLYTNLNQCKFKWQLVSFPNATNANTNGKVLSTGTATMALAPGEKGWLKLNLPAYLKADALYLSAYDASGMEIYTWSWPLTDPADVSKIVVSTRSSTAIAVKEEGRTIALTADNVTYHFNKSTGFLQKVFNGKQDVAFADGPALAGIKTSLKEFKHYKQGSAYIIEPFYEGEGSYKVKWKFEPGQLPKLEYSYNIRGEADYMGITFNYPEEKVTGVKWLGRGPYRVWKNRLKGNQLGVWQKQYNNTITGETFVYPEFKGWHAGLYWMQLQTKEAPFTVYTSSPNLFLNLYKPERPKGASNENTSPPFPDGNIGFMHAISAIGTKFQPAEVMGPQSQKNRQLNNRDPLHGELWFDFRAR